MMVQGTVYAKYGTQTTFYFMLEDGSAATKFYTGTDVVAGDAKIYKDGGAVASTSNNVVTTQSPLFAITLTATEMQATDISLRVTDASSTVYKDLWIVIKTKLQVGQIDADATALSNTHGIVCTGVGTGYGLKTVGATTALSHNLLDIVEAAEPSAALASTDSVWNIIKVFKRRFFNKTTVSGSSLIIYKDNSTSTLSTQAVSDDGTTDTIGKAS